MIAVGIDIAKRTHEACFMGHDGRQIGKARRFHNTRLGVRALLDDLQQLREPATIGLKGPRPRIARRGGSPREGARSEARAEQRLAAGGAAPLTRTTLWAERRGI